MADSQPGTAIALRLERTINAPPERVFDAFTQAPTLSRWFSPSDAYACTVRELDPRPGGRYRIELLHTSGKLRAVYGAYEQVERPSRLVFSFLWENQPENGESRVTVSIEKAGEGTKLVLVQERFPTAEVRDAHVGGWTGSLDRLVKLY
jgi:uncharacterized protein YndB with AHSA1/START domain